MINKIKIYTIGLLGAVAGLSLPFWGPHDGLWHVIDVLGVVFGVGNLYAIYDYWKAN